MEWVETTGSTIEEAKEAALDELGVDEAEAEFEVISEARAGLFGRLRSEARVRARVRPTAPRAKEDRRDRRRRAASNKDAAASSSVVVEPAAPSAEGSAASGNGADAPRVATGAVNAVPPAAQEPAGEAASRTTNRRRRNRRPATRSRQEQQAGSQPGEDRDQIDNEEREGADVEVDLEEQGKVAAEFLTQLTAEFGLNASVAIRKQDDDTLDVQMTGSDLGLLIGPKGATLLAIQNLTRTIVHYETGANNGHINIDVGGYRQKRTEALVRFAHQVADKVKQSGARTALEPMSAVDRKVVHDAISEIDGVATVSEGEDPRRRVVVIPSPANS